MNGEWEEFDEFDFEEGYQEDPFLGGLIRRIPWKRLARTAGQSILGAVQQAIGGEGEEEGLDYEEFDGYEEFGAGDEVMEILASRAAAADTEEEAEAFIGALLPLATSLVPKLLPVASKVLPQVISAGQKVLPQLVSGAQGLVKTLWRSPATKPLIRTIPNIARNTAAQIARQVAAGKPVTPNSALRTLASQSARMLQNPKRCGAAMRHTRQVAGRAGRRMAPAVAAVA